MNDIKILTIDDDPDFNALLAKRLEKFNLEVITTQTCQEFIEQLRSSRPDLCIIDINLQEGQGSGFLLLKAVKNSIFTTVTFVLSRRSSDDDIKKALEHGADEFIPKPLDEVALIGKINQRLNASLESPQFKYKTVPDSYADLLIKAPAQIKSITEKGIYIESKHIFRTNMFLQTASLKKEIITNLSRDNIRLKVNNIKHLAEKECYLIELLFDEYDTELINEVRDWLIENC